MGNLATRRILVGPLLAREAKEDLETETITGVEMEIAHKETMEVMGIVATTQIKLVMRTETTIIKLEMEVETGEDPDASTVVILGTTRGTAQS